MQVLIIADDLTGALDSAVTLVTPGRRAIVARRPGDVASALRHAPDVLAVSTASREGSAQAAREAVAATVAAVMETTPLPPLVLKKVDSRLKGHVREEVAELAALTGRETALVAPAIPGLGRIVAGGHVRGAGVERPIDVGAAVAGALPHPLVPDTGTDADLDAALGSALAGPAPLLVGAAGLAAAVARLLGGEPTRPRHIAGPVLFAIGSRDPVTMAQVAALEQGGAPVTLAPDGRCPPGGAGIVRLVAGTDGAFDAASAGARFAAGIADRVAAGGLGSLLACGGETADAILGALGVGVLELDGEILPGVPVSTMLDGGRSLHLVTKSGGFGDPDTLASVLGAARVAGKDPLEGAR